MYSAIEAALGPNVVRVRKRAAALRALAVDASWSKPSIWYRTALLSWAGIVTAHVSAVPALSAVAYTLVEAPMGPLAGHVNAIRSGGALSHTPPP